MADGKHWAKLWYSALNDDDLLSLPPADRWAWAALMAYTRMHGTKGELEIHPHNPSLATAFGCSVEEVLPTIKRLPNISVEESRKCNNKILLHWKNWIKYAEDNSLERVRKFRLRHSVTPKRRGEEKREEETRTTPPTPSGGNASFNPKDFVSLWNKHALVCGLSKCLDLTEARRVKITSRLRRHPEREFWEAIMQTISQTDFLTGNGNTGWRADIDWLIRNDENPTKIAEGKYGGKKLTAGQRTARNLEQAFGPSETLA